jgi:rare lipoprotein A
LGKSYHVLATEQGYSERGVASWYGQKFHGHKTSNGEVFDMNLASAAHKSLPIPSFLRVTNLDNNRSIVVRVNDRGPFHGDRLIDLSYAAAVKLDYADSGTARVQLDAIVAPTSDRERFVAQRSSTDAQSLGLSSGLQPAGEQYLQPAGEQYLQIGAFAELRTAQEVSNQLRTLTSLPVFIRSVDNQSNGVLHRVRVGPVSDPGQIRQITQRVVAANLGSPYTITE